MLLSSPCAKVITERQRGPVTNIWRITIDQCTDNTVKASILLPGTQARQWTGPQFTMISSWRGRVLIFLPYYFSQQATLTKASGRTTAQRSEKYYDCSQCCFGATMGLVGSERHHKILRWVHNNMMQFANFETWGDHISRKCRSSPFRQDKPADNWQLSFMISFIHNHFKTASHTPIFITSQMKNSIEKWFIQHLVLIYTFFTANVRSLFSSIDAMMSRYLISERGG